MWRLVIYPWGRDGCISQMTTDEEAEDLRMLVTVNAAGAGILSPAARYDGHVKRGWAELKPDGYWITLAGRRRLEELERDG